MSRFQQDSDARTQVEALGRALAELRRACGLSQSEAGGRIGMTSQGWGLYEAGKRSGLFRPDVQRRLTGAVEASPEMLALALARSGPQTDAPTRTGLESRGRVFEPVEASPVTAKRPQIERLQLSDDDLAPWAASGVVLEYDTGRWPRRDQGCVIDMAAGGRLVRLYDRVEGDVLYVRGGPGGLAQESRIPRAAAVRVSAVVARLDQQ